jgi:hypothetical protein
MISAMPPVQLLLLPHCQTISQPFISPQFHHLMSLCHSGSLSLLHTISGSFGSFVICASETGIMSAGLFWRKVKIGQNCLFFKHIFSKQWA